MHREYSLGLNMARLREALAVDPTRVTKNKDLSWEKE
jgi:hypothetical protein